MCLTVCLWLFQTYIFTDGEDKELRMRTGKGVLYVYWTSISKLALIFFVVCCWYRYKASKISNVYTVLWTISVISVIHISISWPNSNPRHFTVSSHRGVSSALIQYEYQVAISDANMQLNSTHNLRIKMYQCNQSISYTSQKLLYTMCHKNLDYS